MAFGTAACCTRGGLSEAEVGDGADQFLSQTEVDEGLRQGSRSRSLLQGGLDGLEGSFDVGVSRELKVSVMSIVQAPYREARNGKTGRAGLESPGSVPDPIMVSKNINHQTDRHAACSMEGADWYAWGPELNPSCGSPACTGGPE